MEPEDLLRHSQAHATCPHPKPEQSSPCPHPISLKSILILFSRLRTDISSVPFPEFSAPKSFIAPFFPPRVPHDLPISFYLRVRVHAENQNRRAIIRGS